MSEHRTENWRLTLLLIVSSMAGCSYAPEQTDTGTVISAGGGTGEVQEIHLKDGTPCAVVMGYQKGAISCGWRNAQ